MLTLKLQNDSEASGSTFKLRTISPRSQSDIDTLEILMLREAGYPQPTASFSVVLMAESN